MKCRVLSMAVVLAGASVPVLACDLEAAGAAEYLAQYDFAAMAEQERAEAQKRALQQFHDTKMAEARAAFVGRFKTAAGTQAASTVGAGSGNVKSPAAPELAISSDPAVPRSASP